MGEVFERFLPFCQDSIGVFLRESQRKVENRRCNPFGVPPVGTTRIFNLPVNPGGRGRNVHSSSA